MFTYQYAQPDFYHYSLDSTELARFTATQLNQRTDLSELKTLDLCAGCGVVGFELSWHLPALRKIDFVEVQEIYTPYFQQNVQIVNRKELELNWHVINYDELHAEKWQNKYDLIISNPPYFYPNHSVLSPSPEKNRCRFFIDSNFENYILAIANSLTQNGEAYILLRSLKAHGIDVFTNLNQYLTKTNITATNLTTIRGTNIILLKNQTESLTPLWF